MFADLFRSLAFRNFRLYFTGQVISTIGSWMQNVAQAWLVYRLTHSGFMLGLVAFAGLLPVLLLGLHGGLLADRVSRRKLLLLLHAIAMVQSFLLAYLINTNAVTPQILIGFALVLGTLHALEMPTRHAFIAELVPREHLPNAVALNSSVFNLARFVGPGLAALIFYNFNESLIYSLNGLSFLVMVAILLQIDIAEQPPNTDRRSSTQRILEAIRYAWRNIEVRFALILLATFSLISTAPTVLMPIFARELFSGDAKTFSTLIGSMGIGAFLAAMRLAYLSGKQHLPVQIRNAVMGAGAIMMVLPLLPHVTPAFYLLVLLGFALSSTVAAINTLIQLHVPDQLRGRVMALFSVFFIGLTSLGNLGAGALAEATSAHHTVMLYGALCLTAGSLYGICVKRCAAATE